jgi:hypothetical protein
MEMLENASNASSSSLPHANLVALTRPHTSNPKHSTTTTRKEAFSFFDFVVFIRNQIRVRRIRTPMRIAPAFLASFSDFWVDP